MTVYPPSDDRILELEHELADKQRNLHTLLEVARASRGVTDPNVVLEAIYTQLSALLPVDAFSVVVCTNDQVDTYRYMLLIDEGKHYDVADSRSGGLTGYILRNQEPLLFRDLHAEYPPDLPRAEAFGNTARRSRSWIGVPVFAGPNALGVITVQSYQKGVYTHSDLDLLLALADLAAVAIENAVLYEQQAQLTLSLAERVTARQAELSMLSALSAGLSRGQSTPALLSEALERVLRLLNLDAGAVWLQDRKLSLRRAAWRSNDGRLPSTDERMTLSGPSLEAEAVRIGQLLQQSQPDEQAACAVPLQVHGRLVGVMTLWGKRSLQSHETTLLTAAADQIALGIENGRLLQERDRQISQLEALSTIAEASAATRDLRPMLQEVFETLQSSLPIDGFLAALYNPGTNELLEGVGWQKRQGMRHVNASVDGDSYIAQLLEGEQPVLLRLPADSLRRDWWEEDAAVWLGVPMLGHNNQPVGLIAIQSSQPDVLDRRDLQFMTNVAHQLTLNVVNAQLYVNARTSAAVAERRANNLTLMHSISRLVSASLDPNEVLRIAAEQLTKLFGVDHCNVILFHEGCQYGEIVAEHPSLNLLNRRFEFSEDEQLEDEPGSGRPSFINDVLHDPRLRAGRELIKHYGVQAVLLVPLLARGRSFGVISLYSITTTRTFGDEELELCSTIAAQVTAALENARLHQMTVTRVEQELDIARTIQSNLFPRTLPQIEGVLLAGRCIPARETGGDFYDVLPLGDNLYGFSIGDVSGKSLPAAMLMAVARSIVRSEALDHAAPEAVMTETNRLIVQDVPPNTFVALCYAVYDPRHHELVISNAGQVMPLVRHADGSAEWLELQPNFPMGIIDNLEYQADTVSLVPGDTILFLTDGLVEAFSPEREMFGFDRVRDLFAACGDQPPEVIVTTLLDTLCAWQGNENRHDDMTVIVAQIQ